MMNNAQLKAITTNTIGDKIICYCQTVITRIFLDTTTGTVVLWQAAHDNIPIEAMHLLMAE